MPFANSFALDCEGRCALCAAGLRGFDTAFHYGWYEGTLRELVHLFKYECIRTLASPLGRLLVRAVPVDTAIDAVVPVPLHWRRRWARGFNQAELLAAEAARSRGVPVLRALRRRRHTPTQTGLTHAQRRKNIAGAFTLTGKPVEGLRLLLVDDVMTTGATLSVCAALLRRAGARSVLAATLARTDRRFSVPTAKAQFAGAAR